MKKLIKQQVKDNNSILYNNEFFITDKLYDKYKVQYFDGYILNLSRLLEEENIETYYINLNGFFCYLDACYLENKDFCFKNGFVMFTDPIEDKCGRALILENSYVEFRECVIQTPYAEAIDMSIIELDNSLISFKNSNINVKFATDRKSFIDLQSNSRIEMESTTVEAGCNETIQNYNIGFDFVKVSGEDTSIEVKNCAKIRIANDLADNGEDLEFNFIKTDENIDSTIVLFNNVIWMHGIDSQRNVLNVNLDNKDIHIDNNDLQGTLKTRLESSNTVYGNGYPHTYNQGDEVWDLFVYPSQKEDSLDFNFTDDNGFIFLETVDIDPNDMSNGDKEFIFTWKEIDGESGFILNYNDEQSYTTDDLISFNDMENIYGITDIDEELDVDNWLGIKIEKSISKYHIEETFTIQNGPDFIQANNDGKCFKIEENIHSLSNSSVGEMENDWFFVNRNGGIGNFKSLYLNNRKYDYIPRNNTYYLEDEDDFMSAFYNMNNNRCDTLDLSKKSIVCDTYLRDKSFTIKNGTIELLNHENPFGDGSRILQLIDCYNITFENVSFRGYFETVSNKPVFDFINSQVCFKNCNFSFYSVNDKTIFKSDDSELTFLNCTGQFEGENNVKVIESINSSTLHIDGVSGIGKTYNDQFLISTEDNNSVFIDGSNGNVDFYIKNCIVLCENEAKGLILRITDDYAKDLINSSFLNGSFKVIPGTEIAEYQNNHHYQPGERYEEEDEEWYEGGDEFYFVENDRIRTARCIQEYTSSGDFNQDLEDGYIEETTPNNRVHMNNVTYDDIDGGNPDFFIKDGNSNKKISTSISNLYNTDINNENFDENNGQLVYTQGTWKETKFIEIEGTTPRLEIEPGLVYNCIEPLTSLTLVTLPEGMAESTVKFKVGYDFEFKPALGMKYIGNLPDDWDEGEEYLISILMGTFTITKINTVE